ncbi:hypothetical protein [Salinarimonas sp.]|uniref:hypothetical protein n=1 Tax=Salinarimonas sp. TaxID=2766526 RepID=UPI00391A74D1
MSPAPHHHGHEHAPRPRAAAPTLSLLRMSAGMRLAGASAIVLLVWLAILATVRVI